ncbi:MAG: T9SS type A sorting domain-containing protein, partial [Bacteroidales bacterium]|nr:T9SS type A sorting domain-containing protein [Bacteroidales bacterium]
PSYTLAGGLPVNGIYSGTGVSSGSFAATTAGAGLHTVTYLYTDANGCADSAAQTQLVNALPVVSMTALTDLCADAADYTLSGGTPTNGTYSGTGVSGGLFSAATSGVGSFYITYSYTDANSCTDVDSIAQVVNALPVVTFTGLAATYCGNSMDDTLLANPLGGTFTGVGISSNIFSPSTAGVGSFDVTYDYTDVNGCSSSDTNSTVVNAVPIVDLGSDATICAIDSVLVDAGAGMSTYAWNTGEITQSIYADSLGLGIGTFTFLALVTDANNCSNSDSVDITFEAAPVSQLTDTASICGEGQSLTLDAGASTLYDYAWSTGETTSSIIVDTTVLGNNMDYVYVTLTSPIGCATNDSALVYFREVPMPFIGNDTTICWNHHIMLDAGAGYTSYLWNTGETTQTISLDSMEFIIGSNDYSVEVVNSVYCTNSDTMTMVIDPCTGIYTQELSYEEIRIYPNPSKGRFQIDISGLENENYDLGIYNSMGSRVFGEKLNSNGKSTHSWEVDLSTFAKGVYIVRLQSKGMIKVKRIIIQ